MPRYKRTVDLQDLIVNLAASRRGMSLDDMVARYGVSRRTCERMRNAIALRFPVVEVRPSPGDRRKRWRIVPLATHDLVRFDAADDALLIEVVQTLWASGRDELAEGLGRIAKRVRLLR